LPNDDVYTDDYDTDSSQIDSSKQASTNNPALSSSNSLFVNDCLKTYSSRKRQIRYKYHSFGGNFKQLPSYDESSCFLNRNFIDLNYEIDIEDEQRRLTNDFLISSNKFHDKNAFEKHGWLNYKLLTSTTVDNKNFKKRYFHLRQSPYQQQTKEENGALYVFECFKEVPGVKSKSENPKLQIFLDSQTTLKYSQRDNEKKTNQFLFELMVNKDESHIFMVENQKQYEEWLNILKTIVVKHVTNLPQCELNILNQSKEVEKLSVSFTSSSSPSSNASSSNHDKRSSLTASSLNDSNSNTSNLSTNSCSLTIDLSKYINEKEDELFIEKNPNKSVNLFDLYPKATELLEEETELDCTWPEKLVGRKLHLDCQSFKLNLNFPLPASSSTNFSTSSSFTNPELFFLIFSLYDAKSMQKISENFHWIPNYELFTNQFDKSKSSISNGHANTNQLSPSSSLRTNGNHIEPSDSNVFSLDGKGFLENAALHLSSYSELKESYLNRISKALFTVLDVHDEIYLVVRIEKILDGSSLHSSIQPYLVQNSEGNKLKMAIKLNKKMQQLLKTKICAYRQPFAWAVKPVYKKLDNSNRFKLDSESRFQVFVQEAQHLGDEDLFRYLSDFQAKEKSITKLTQINCEFKIFLSDFSAEMFEADSDFSLSKNLLDSSLNFDIDKLDITKLNEYILNIDHFEPVISSNSILISDLAEYSSSSSAKSPNQTNAIMLKSAQVKTRTLDSVNSSPIRSQRSANSNPPILGHEHFDLLHKARLLRTNTEFKCLLYVYPKCLKYDTQKTYSRARNILVRVEMCDRDLANEDTSLKCIFKLNANVSNSSDSSLLVSSYSTIVTYHNKTPQFYDEIKVLLPLNLSEKHHLLFKFYHISCSNAKMQSNSNTHPSDETISDLNNPSGVSFSSTNQANTSNSQKLVETLIGYSWLPVFKSGRLINGEKHLPVAQTLSNNYLAFEQIGLGQSVGPNDIKWVENMKPLFKLSVVAHSTVHTIVS
jgi:hypothetical protein